MIWPMSSSGKNAILEREITLEMEENLELFDCRGNNKEAHYRTAKMGLLVRKWIEENDLIAYTLNFANIERSAGFECVPFIEACKTMSRGVGFAGEGDTLTALLCGSTSPGFMLIQVLLRCFVRTGRVIVYS